MLHHQMICSGIGERMTAAVAHNSAINGEVLKIDVLVCSASVENCASEYFAVNEKLVNSLIY